jgi:SAM-dependent methyltransferase
MTFTCRSCSGNRFAPVIDLGATPLANALLDPTSVGQPEPRYPLNVVFCQDCSLVQITETVPPEVLFSNYVYFSSFSDTAVASAKAIAQRLARQRKLGASSVVFEAASNDGYLLRHYRDLGVKVVGIEPAKNIAEVAIREGIPTRCAFFGLEEAQRMVAEGLRCDVFHANNVLAHVADLNGFVAGLKLVLKEDGIASIEAPYLGDLLAKLEFDTVYHEHLCYFSANALDRLFARHGLSFSDVERIPIHGGSLRIFVTHEGGPRSKAIQNLLKEESERGLTDARSYADFATRISDLRRDLVSMLQGLKSKGNKIAAYGASAKGATLLNFFGIGPELLDFVADRSTVKQGRLTPGTHLPIVAPEALLERKPDYVLLLTWNFAEEILAQQAEYRNAGGKFIVPVPEARIV